MRRPRPSRVLLASLLTAGAIAVPSVYWFVAGSRAVETEQAALTEGPARQATEAATRVAQRIEDRLTGLAARESARPFFHYQNLYVDPRGAYDGEAVTPSPLASGPGEPLVRGNFQLDAAGLVTLPTINPEAPELSAADAQVALLTQLAETLPTYLGREQPAPPPATAPPAAEPPADAIQQVAVAPTRKAPSKVANIVQEQRLATDLYVANQNANDIYWDIQTKQGKGQRPAQKVSAGTPPAQQRALPPPDRDGDGEVTVRVGAFTWHTLEIAGQPELVALRDVETPDGDIAQGFIVARSALSDLLSAGGASARLAPGPGEGPGQADVLLPGTTWHVAVDHAAAIAAAREESLAAASAFGWRFGVGAALAVLAGLSVILMVWHSERLSRRRVQFAAAAAHELRTPLSGLRMYGEMLAEGLGNPDKKRAYARRIANEAERLGRVVANVLDFTRLERGSLAVAPTPGDLTAVVDDIAARLAPAVEAAGASLIVERGADDAAADPLSASSAPPLPAVRLDRDAMAQVLSNLVDNAEKYARGAADRRIHLVLAPTADGGASVTVRDHGDGVPRALRRRLFRAFSRGDDRDQPAGLGLGLSLSRVLTEAQGGRLELLDGAPGAAFRVSLPPA